MFSLCRFTLTLTREKMLLAGQKSVASFWNSAKSSHPRLPFRTSNQKQVQKSILVIHHRSPSEISHVVVKPHHSPTPMTQHRPCSRVSLPCLRVHGTTTSIKELSTINKHPNDEQEKPPEPSVGGNVVYNFASTTVMIAAGCLFGQILCETLFLETFGSEPFRLFSSGSLLSILSPFSHPFSFFTTLSGTQLPALFLGLWFRQKAMSPSLTSPSQKRFTPECSVLGYSFSIGMGAGPLFLLSDLSHSYVAQVFGLAD